MKKLSTILFLLIIVIAVSIPAKTQTTTIKKTQSDTILTEEIITIQNYWRNISPTIQLFYSWSTPYLYDEAKKDYQNPFVGEFAKGNYGEIRLGTTKWGMIYPDQGIADYEFTSVFFKYMGPSEYSKEEVERNQYNLKTIQFGIFSASGYGYQSKKSNFGIYLYTGSGIHWSDVSYTVESGGDESSNEALNTFDNNLRFGQNFESGLRFQLVGPLNLIAAYESSIIFPRHLFWKWTISGLIEAVGIGGLGEFSKWIMRESPAAGPVVNWALKTGFYYLMYELRKKDMNWPYNTAPPLMINSWKAGISLEF